MQKIFSISSNLLGEIALHWSFLDKTPFEKMAKARDKILSGHDDVIVDSTREYLLLNTNDGLFLISRKEAWKARLGEDEEAIYTRLGRKSFRKIRKLIE